MWEIIRKNKRKTYLLLLVLGLNFFLLGFLVLGAVFLFFGFAGDLYGRELYMGGVSYGLIGGCIGLFFFIIQGLTSYFNGNEIVLSRCGARELTRAMQPQLFNILEEMLIAAHYDFRPKLYATPSMTPNAFALGIKEENSAIVVTTGLLTQLNRNQLQGVIAHELSHIINRDTLYLTFAGTILNLKVASLLGENKYSSTNNKQSGENFLFELLMEVFQEINKGIYFSLSQNREYLADASAVRLTRYPEGLASALEKIATDKTFLHEARWSTAPFYIINPIDKENTKTHPPVRERINILRNITRGANYKDYQNAYNSIALKTENIFPNSALEDEDIPLVEDTEIGADSAERSLKDLIRETKDLNKAIRDYRFMICNCGIKFKIPPEFKREYIHCPRCGVKNQVKRASREKPEDPFKKSPFEDGTRIVNGLIDGNTYIRSEVGSWESFYCDCGYVLQLAPNFRGKKIRCFHCDREINIKENTDKSKADKIRETLKGDEEKEKYIMTHQRQGDEWEFFSCDCGNVIQLSEGFKKKSIRCEACRGKIKIIYPERAH